MENKKVQQYQIDKVTKIKEMLQQYTDFLLTDYRGLNVAQVTELRNQLREKDAVFTVIKNNLAKIAFQELKMPQEEGYFIGPTALTLVKEDTGPIAKILLDFSKNSPLQFKGGVVGGKAFQAEQVEALSKLPDKNTLLAMLMGTMNAPLVNLMNVMQGVVLKLARTLLAVAEKKESK